MRPKVGFKPTTPQRAAGIRTDPRNRDMDEAFSYKHILQIYPANLL
jgi:hypothetical protein